MNREFFDMFFDPRSIAVVGATENVGKWGFYVMQSLLEAREGRAIFPVNRRGGSLFGLHALRSLAELPQPVDLAVIVVPAPWVREVVREGEGKVRAYLVITSGFGEMGERGREEERELVRTARSFGARIIGPNSFGHLNARAGISTLAFVEKPLPGGISIASQSGNCGVYLVRRGRERGIGLAKFISTGNEADITFEDWVEYFFRDPETEIILGYVEGLREGRRFFELLQNGKKPVLLIKGGRTPAGARAAASHTGALAGEEGIFEAAMRQSGVILAEDLDELLETAALLLSEPAPRGRRVGIVTGGGGYGVLAADACEKAGLVLAPLSPKTMERIDEILPPRWPRSNPVDTVMAFFAAYRCLEILLEDENVDAALMIGGIGISYALQGSIPLREFLEKEEGRSFFRAREEEELEDLERVLEKRDKMGKPVVFCSIFSEALRGTRLYEAFRRRQIPLFSSPQRAVKALSNLIRYAEFHNEEAEGAGARRGREDRDRRA